MPATITATGTFSTLDNNNPTSQAPGAVPNEIIRQHYDGVEQKFQPRSLDYHGQYRNDVDAMQETMQFIALVAAAYSIPALAAATRVRDIIGKAFFNTEGPSEQRTFTA